MAHHGGKESILGIGKEQEAYDQESKAAIRKQLGYVHCDPYNEGASLQETAERYRERTGHYPERILADQIKIQKRI